MNYYLFNPTGNITALITDNTPAQEVMNAEPSCEQAGYIGNKEGYDIYLRMAGGEFCGNATMCAASLTGKEETEVYVEGTGPVKVRKRGNKYSVKMPEPVEISMLNGYPLVRFEGIDHVICEDGSLDSEKITEWCTGKAMGFMYLDGNELKPLVYVKDADTLFWENSCASGTCSVGEYLNKAVRLKNPAGILEYDGGWLTGTVELLKQVM